jgi:small subunit ribosomal protein S17e
MGKIKSTLAKRACKNLIKNNPGRFSKSFDENKKLLPDVSEIRSKKLRNVIAGYLARLTRKETQ